MSYVFKLTSHLFIQELNHNSTNISFNSQINQNVVKNS